MIEALAKHLTAADTVFSALVYGTVAMYALSYVVIVLKTRGTK